MSSGPAKSGKRGSRTETERAPGVVRDRRSVGARVPHTAKSIKSSLMDNVYYPSNRVGESGRGEGDRLAKPAPPGPPRWSRSSTFACSAATSNLTRRQALRLRPGVSQLREHPSMIHDHHRWSSRARPAQQHPRRCSRRNPSNTQKNVTVTVCRRGTGCSPDGAPDDHPAGANRSQAPGGEQTEATLARVRRSAP